LKNLKRNNSKEWFEANREKYNEAKEYFEEFVALLLEQMI
jgi:hypothetical protein